MRSREHGVLGSAIILFICAQSLTSIYIYFDKRLSSLAEVTEWLRCCIQVFIHLFEFRVSQ